MIDTQQIWIAQCDYPHCTEVIKTDTKMDLRIAMGMTGWKEAWGGKCYCYKHVQSDKKVKLEHSKEKLVYVHSEILCKGQPCAIHNRTDHIMRKFPQHWRADRGIIERICPHGVGHPDPDQRDFMIQSRGIDNANAEFVHGCDGCCTRSTDVVQSQHDTSRAKKSAS